MQLLKIKVLAIIFLSYSKWFLYFSYSQVMLPSFPFWTRVIVELAIPCEEPRERVFEGFTVGFLPRTWEIVRKFFLVMILHSCLFTAYIIESLGELIGTQWHDSIGI